jgi:hypothetical protein
MPASVGHNCSACSKIDISEVKLKHCWDEKRCHRRRSDERRKADRSVHDAKGRESIEVESPQIYHGILQLWREPREDAPLHAIGLEIKLGDESIAIVAPVHCAGWMPSQVHQYIDRIVEFTSEKYQFKKFSSFVILSPSRCSIQGCFREQ